MLLSQFIFKIKSIKSNALSIRKEFRKCIGKKIERFNNERKKSSVFCDSKRWPL